MRWVYSFGAGEAEGRADMKNLLGGKGANLAEMTNLGMPVPPGFTLTTEVCTQYYENDRALPAELDAQIKAALQQTESIMGQQFGGTEKPLLVSVRSGARQSMPGMMETVLNVGLTTQTIPALIAKSDNPRFVYDAYRRLIMMYADVVMEKAAGIEPRDGAGIRHQMERMIAEHKEQNGLREDVDLSGDDWKS